jgi:hypothetical protein
MIQRCRSREEEGADQLTLFELGGRLSPPLMIISTFLPVDFKNDLSLFKDRNSKVIAV